MERRVAEINLYDGGQFRAGWRIEVRRGEGYRWHAETEDVYESKDGAEREFELLLKKSEKKARL